MATAPAKRTPAGRRLVLSNVDWQTYSRLLRIFAERRSVRLTYDRGVLEIMSPLFEHEFHADLLGRFVVTLTEEYGLPVQAGGSTTLRKRKRRRGLEPDRCWWIVNEPRMRGKVRYNPRTDPPPDLALEVDITRSSLNRMSIYAALGVPEIWRCKGQDLTFNTLQPNGTYAVVPNSLSFPLVTPRDLLGFLALRAQMDENAVVRQFRAWVRQQLAAGGPSAAAPTP